MLTLYVKFVPNDTLLLAAGYFAFPLLLAALGVWLYSVLRRHAPWALKVVTGDRREPTPNPFRRGGGLSYFKRLRNFPLCRRGSGVGFLFLSFKNMNDKNRFFFILNSTGIGDWANVVWSDVDRRSKLVLYNMTFSSPLLNKIKKAHFANRANSRVWLPLKSLWDRAFTVQSRDLSTDGTNYLVFHTCVKFSPSHIRRLKRHADVRVVLYLPDTLRVLNIAADEKQWERYRRHYMIDEVYSFDPADCRRYGFRFFDIYSALPDCKRLADHKPSRDLFYIGSCRTAERLALVQGIYRRATEAGVRCDFRMTGVPESDVRTGDGITYNQRLAYQDVVVQTLRSGCILEILNPGQHGNTLRYKEAVVYGRRLVSNNPDILTSQYYDPRYMQYFERPEDIDMQWLLADERASYPYEGEYSPMTMIRMMEER